MIEGSTVKKSLLTELTTLGVDDWLFVINVQLFLVMAGMFKIYLWVIVSAVMHVALMVVTQVQPVCCRCTSSLHANASATARGVSRSSHEGLSALMHGWH